MYYTYVWRDANGTPFYVGKGKGRRAYNTTASRRSADFLAVYAQGGCTVEIVDDFILESQAHAKEVELIERYGRREFGGLLINKTDGGEGMSGAVMSAESRSKQSKARIGIVFTEEHRANIGAAQRGHTRWAGKKHKPSTIEKFRVIHGGRSEETRANMSAALTGRKLDNGHKENIGAAMRNSGPRGGFKGVSFDRNKSRWSAKIKIAGRTVNLGRFEEAETAAHVYDDAAVEAWGLGNCYINFPDRYQLLA